MERVLVTGATGYVGKHLVAALLREGCVVHALVRPTSDVTRLATLDGTPVVEIYDGSTESVLQIVRHTVPDVVFHLAGLMVAEHDPEHVEALIHANVLLGTQLAEGALCAGSACFINTGTFWQHYGGADAYDAVCLYAATKQAFEDILRFYVSAAGLKALTLSLFDVYGPDDHRDKLFAQLRRAADEDRTLTMSPGEQLLDLVYVDDVVRAYLHAARLIMGDATNVIGRSFAVTSGSRHRLREVVALFGEVLGKAPPVRWGGRRYRPREVMTPWHGARLPGWRAEVDLAEGLRRMLEP